MFAKRLTFNPRSKATNIGYLLSLGAVFGYWSKIRIPKYFNKKTLFPISTVSNIGILDILFVDTGASGGCERFKRMFIDLIYFSVKSQSPGEFGDCPEHCEFQKIQFFHNMVKKMVC